MVAERDRARPRLLGARVGVRPGQRAHRHARRLRGGRAGRRPRHVPERLLRGAAAALRRGRLRLPRAGPDDGQRHRRQADPAAGQGLAARPRLRRDHRHERDARPAGRRAAPVAPSGARRAAGRAGDAAPGWSRWPGASIAAIEYKVEPPTSATCTSPCSRTCWPTSRRRRRSDDPRAAAALEPPLQSEELASAAAGARCSCTGPSAAGCGSRPAWTTSSRPRRQHRGHRGQRRPGRVRSPPRHPAGRLAAAGQVPRLRLVVPAVAPGAARPGRGGAGHGEAARLGPPGPRAARAAGPALGRGRRRDRGRRRAAAGRPRRHVPRPAGRRARRAAARSRPRA